MLPPLDLNEPPTLPPAVSRAAAAGIKAADAASSGRRGHGGQAPGPAAVARLLLRPRLPLPLLPEDEPATGSVADDPDHVAASVARRWLRRGGHGLFATVAPATGAREVSLQSALRAHFLPSVVEGRRCDGCRRSGCVVSRPLLSQPLPPIVVVILKRFDVAVTGAVSKRTQPVSFPVDGLDLSPFLREDYDEGAAATAAPPARRPAASLPEGVTVLVSPLQRATEAAAASERPHLAAAPPSPRRRPSPPAPYDLFAAVCHVGSADAGHYVTVARRPGTGSGDRPGPWRLFNDTTVDDVPDEDLHSPGMREQAYLLFYARRRTPLSRRMLLRGAARAVPDAAAPQERRRASADS